GKSTRGERGRWLRGCGIPSTSTRAITPRAEGKPGMVVGGAMADLRAHVALRPRRDRATPGRRDATPNPRPLALWPTAETEQFRSKRLIGERRTLAPDDTKPQLRGYVAALSGSRWSDAAAFTPKRSLVRSQ